MQNWSSLPGGRRQTFCVYKNVFRYTVCFRVKYGLSDRPCVVDFLSPSLDCQTVSLFVEFRASWPIDMLSLLVENLYILAS